MCSTAFGFGENDTNLLECPSRRIYHNLPARLAASIEEGDVAAVLNVAFGPGGSYAVAFREPCSRECRLQTHELPADLQSWLFKKDSNGQFERSFLDFNDCLELTATIKIILDNKRLTELKNVSLSPFKKNTFALLLGDILIHNNMPKGSHTAVGKLAADIKEDVASARQAAAQSSQQSNNSLQRRIQQDM